MSTKITNECVELYMPELELVVVEQDNQNAKQDTLNNILTEYRILNEKCDLVLNKIAQRKNRN